MLIAIVWEISKTLALKIIDIFYDFKTFRRIANTQHEIFLTLAGSPFKDKFIKR